LMLKRVFSAAEKGEMWDSTDIRQVRTRPVGKGMGSATGKKREGDNGRGEDLPGSSADGREEGESKPTSVDLFVKL
jgi:hypothetical protein